jgi:hypothetical protein
MKESEIETIIGATSRHHPLRRVTDLKPKQKKRE